MEIYLDNSATTKCAKSVREIMQKVMETDYGNPSSLHAKGVEAEKYVKEAAAKIAKTLKVSEKEIIFTSGGTESNNLALIGAAMANRRAGNRLVTTGIEHASVFHTMAFLEEQGFEVIYLPTDREGVVSLEALRDAVNEETILVSIMQVNNEIGTIQPIDACAAIIREKTPKALFHVDAVQSYGRMPIRPKKTGIDLLSVSGHKIHGPKGVGFLYVKEKTKIKPLLFGGGQQSGMRPGTHNVPGIAGLGVAAAEIYEDVEKKAEYLYSLRERFLTHVLKIEGVTINGKTNREGAPHIVSVSASGVRSEVFLHALEAYGIYASAGAACSANRRTASRTLLALGTDASMLDAALRFSFSGDTTPEEIDDTAEKMAQIIPKLRKYARH